MIVVLGDPILDVWRYLRRTRPNPEHPSTSVVVTDHRVYRAGGALSVAANLGLLHMVTLVVPTYAGGIDWRLRSLLPARVSVYGPLVWEGMYSVKERVVLEGELLYRLDADCRPATTIGREPLRALLQEQQPTLIVITDYAKGAVMLDEVLGALEYAAERRRPILLDLKPTLYSALQGHAAYRDLALRAQPVIKANQQEVAQFLAGAPDVETFRSALHAHGAVMTAGPNGAWVCCARRDVQHVAAVHRGGNVCGAGDVLTALLAQGMIRHQDLHATVAHAVRRTSALVHGPPDPYTLRLPVRLHSSEEAEAAFGPSEVAE